MQAGARSRRVLVVDDDYSVRRLVALGLELEGYRVDTADNGLAGLRAAHARKPDVIVLDVMMPGRDGFAVLDTIRSSPDIADVPVVLLTARRTREDIRRASDAGADHYLTKPFEFDHLVWQLREMLTASTPDSALAGGDR
jgi:DNA-binding response OmpR family regulator